MIEELTPLQKRIIAKLYTLGYIGAVHTALDNIPKGFPKHLRGDVKKEAEKLIRKGWIILKRTSYGDQTSLNPHRLKEAKQIAETIQSQT